jgi:NADPH:quinone reductase
MAERRLARVCRQAYLSLRALVATGDSRLVELRDVDAPNATSGTVIVDVEAISVNRGELHRLRAARAGWRPGWDFVGTFPCPQAGLPAGARVYGMLVEAAWAERIAVPTDDLASVPHAVNPLDAVALPVAALTALRVLRLAGNLAGRSVLIVGAAGGVGRFAVQLARLFGATVHAHVGRPQRGTGLHNLGAHALWVGTQRPVEPIDIVLDTAGGRSLERAFDLVADEGLIISFGNSAGQDSTVPVSSFYGKQATLRGYHLLRDVPKRPPGSDLGWLIDLVARDVLRVERQEPVPWTNAHRVLRELEDRLIAGKAVLSVRQRRS